MTTITSFEFRITSCELNGNSQGKNKLPKPTGEPCLSCPKTNEEPPVAPVPLERSAEPDRSAPVAKAHGGNRKLTWPQVEAIRLLLRCGQSQRQVARLFNVSRGAITEIASGNTWKESGELRATNQDNCELRVSSDELTTKAKKNHKFNSKGKKASPGPAPEEDGGIWLVTEPVQLPGVLLDIPCGMFRSREQAQAYVREQGERQRQLRITSGELRVEIKSNHKTESGCEFNRKEKA